MQALAQRPPKPTATSMGEPVPVHTPNPKPMPSTGIRLRLSFTCLWPEEEQGHALQRAKERAELSQRGAELKVEEAEMAKAAGEVCEV